MNREPVLVSEYGACDICGKDDHLRRKYFYYDIECECHSPNHFDLVRYCSGCYPVKPKTTTVILKTNNL